MATDNMGIDCISKTDFTKGFQRFYVKWPISNCDKSKYSPEFETTISHVDGTVSFSWQLSIEDDVDKPENTLFGIRLVTDGKLFVPTIVRMSLSTPGKEPFFGVVYFEACNRSEESAWGFSWPTADVSTFTGDEMVFRCWIDIPKATIGGCDIEETDGDESVRTKFQNEFSLYNAKLFESVAIGKDELADITLAILKNKETVHRFFVHRNILAARSPVFQCMFANKQWKENAAKNERLLEIDDIDKETMEIVLKCVYTFALPEKSIDQDQIFKIVYAADKYDLAVLKNYCVSVLIAEADLSNVRVAQLKLAHSHTLDQLKAVCVAQLSMEFAYFKDEKVRANIPDALLSEIIEAVCQRQVDTKEITLSPD